MSLCGVVLISLSAIQIAAPSAVEACFNQDCSGNWTVNSSGCNDLFQCRCGPGGQIALTPRSHVITNEVIVTEAPFQTIRFSENVFLGIAVVAREINATQQ